ncbi:sporulation protein YpjB [Alkalicoccobacillus porphyridii]|uniref:Sporulation protein YpjB n=1 Tax=Alkalicoccobacillus porphyridii TaxID=2597270 RepID=A0A553ZZR8_9BACI|nr:sporulation protein YpjB [Alkalicoccobacillus porphyridii]TSB46931.1 hypothetical protein FN960_07885 [Alkalicoccobacillus porphyridii]
MRYVIMLLLSLFCLSWPTVVAAQMNAVESEWADLNKTADLVLQLTKQGEQNKAKELLEAFSYTWTEYQSEQHVFYSPGAEQAISLTLHQANQALQSADMDESYQIDKVTSLRLAIDALANESQPLWLYSEEALLRTADNVGVAAGMDTPEDFYYQLNELNRQYQVIRPALSIQSVHDTLLLDQQIEDILSATKHPTVEVRTAYAEKLKQDIIEMYEDYDKEEADPSLLWIMFTIGGVIVFSLAYVGWRKYQAEQQKVREKEKS